MLCSDGAFLAATIDEADGTAEGMYVSAFAPSPRSVGDAAWFEAYQAVEYRNPDTYSVNGYVAMQVLAKGAELAKSIEADAIAEALRSNPVPTLLDELTLTARAIWSIRRSGSTRSRTRSFARSSGSNPQRRERRRWRSYDWDVRGSRYRASAWAR